MKKEVALVSLPLNDAVLMSTRELPQTMRARFRVNLQTSTLNEALTNCLTSVGCLRGESLANSPGAKIILEDLSRSLTDDSRIYNYIFAGRCGIGKTTLMFAMQRLLDLLKEFPDAWSYQEIDSLENVYIRAEELRYAVVTPGEFRRAASAPILFIDNLGCGCVQSEGEMSFSENLITTLVRLRSDLALVTVIASEIDVPEIAQTYGERLAGIINSRYLVYDKEWLISHSF